VVETVMFPGTVSDGGVRSATVTVTFFVYVAPLEFGLVVHVTVVVPIGYFSVKVKSPVPVCGPLGV